MASDQDTQRYEPPATIKPPISKPFRKIIFGIVSFLFICVLAVFGYVGAGWTVGDSIYMVIITIFGVGSAIRTHRR